MSQRYKAGQRKRGAAEKDKPQISLPSDARLYCGPVASAAMGISQYHAGVKDLPVAVRPRERLQHRGAADLSDAELLAIIVRTGTPSVNALEMSTRALAHHGGLGGLDRAGLTELCAVTGMGPVKAAQIKAGLELGKRLVSLNPGQRARIGSPRDVFNLLRGEMSTLEHEQLRVLLLNTRNVVLAAPELYRGSLVSTTVRLGELFREAIRQNVASILLVHNHPSGDPTPSSQDVELTHDAVQAGRLLDIEVLDHVVIGRGEGSFASLKERGLGFGAQA
jgi:DNA repair protein RadC